MWEQINSNRNSSYVLVVLIAGFLLVMGLAFGWAFMGAGGGVAGMFIALAVFLIMLLVTFGSGDKILLSAAGARKITHNDFPQLANVVEEMQIASGLARTPDIYVIDDPTPNAFATGRSPETASVAVTSGLLSKLSRDELQGVIAHEVSHVANRDVVFMMTISVMVGAVALLAEIFWRGLRGFGGGRRSSGGGQLMLVFLAIALLLSILSPIATQFIYFAISRRREYLADACGAQLTRYPEGLASALEKISLSPAPLRRATRVTAPLYISNPFGHKKSFWASLGSTHPPTEERVRILRSMGGGASIADYQRAFQRVAANRGSRLFSEKTLSGNANVPSRGAALVQPAVDHRVVGDVLWQQNGYKFIDCDCGVRIKIPPTFQYKMAGCPRCRKNHEIPE